MLCNYNPERRKHISLHFVVFFLEGSYPIGNISSLTLLLFFASLLKETLEKYLCDRYPIEGKKIPDSLVFLYWRKLYDMLYDRSHIGKHSGLNSLWWVAQLLSDKIKNMHCVSFLKEIMCKSFVFCFASSFWQSRKFCEMICVIIIR